MAKKAVGVPVWISLDSSSGVPIYRQLYERMRAEILAGRLPARTRLPSTRTLSVELGVSRSTVVTAFEHLLGDMGTPRAFRSGVPALDEFPYRVWRRISGNVWRRPPGALLGYGYPAGYGPLREEISAHLGAVRAVRCEPEQVIVVSGSQQALDLASRVLLDPGDAVWVEEISRKLSGLIDASPAGSGMHLVGWLPDGVDDRVTSSLAAGQGVEAPPISLYRKRPDGKGGLDESEIRDGVRRRANALG